MADSLTPDICVIGAGAAGLSVAVTAAALGVPTVLVEKGVMGGECLNTGCLPSKALLAAAKRAHLAQTAAAFGIAASTTVDFAKVRAHVQDTITAVARNDSAERLTGLGVRVIHAAAAFKDRRTLIAGDVEVRARRFVIATGSRPAVPSIPGLDQGPFFTNETIFDLEQRPEHLIIIGAGPIGMEMAQAFRRLGSSVTVLEQAVPLAKDDPECVAVVLDQLEREGVVVRSGVKVTGVAHTGAAVTVTIDLGGAEQTITGSHLLIATGRQPVTDGLNLEAAGIRADHGGIVVNRKLKTANRRVYAIGDCASGQLRFTHAGNYHAGLVLRNSLFRLPVRVDNDAIPWLTFTDPELAQCGLTEAEARKRRLKFRVIRWAYHDNDRAQAERTTRGHIKVLARLNGKIIGITIVGAQAGELMTPWVVAIAQGINIRAFARLVLPYPTLSEVGKRAAIDFISPSLTRPWVRRIIRWLRVFG